MIGVLNVHKSVESTCISKFICDWYFETCRGALGNKFPNKEVCMIRVHIFLHCTLMVLLRDGTFDEKDNKLQLRQEGGCFYCIG